MKDNKSLYISIVLALVACLVVVFLRLFSVADLWFQMFAAILGVIITAIITQVLLKGQTESDSERERNSEVFREKLKIYMDFLKMLCETLKDKKLTEEEAMQLQFQMSYIAMHTKSKNIELLSSNVKDIVEKYTEPGHNPTSEELLPRLFNIVACFREELYPLAQAEYSCGKLNQDINNAIADLKVFDERNYAAMSSARNYEELFNSFNEKGWKLTKETENGCLKLEFIKKDKAGNNMRLFVRPVDDMGTFKYTIGLHYKKDIYERLKQRHQGNIEKDFWWKYLDEDSVNLGTKLDEMLHTDKVVQESVFEPLRILENYLDNYSKLYCIRQYLATKVTDVWNLGQYYDNVLFCEVKKGELQEEGRPYFDIQLGKNGKEATFFIGNRDKDQEKLEATIKRTGIRIKNGKTCADYENTLLADIPEKALEMMKLIAND